MDRVLRLIAALVLALASSLVMAQSTVPADGVPTQPAPTYTIGINGNAQSFGSGQAACNAAGISIYGSSPSVSFSYDGSDHSCNETGVGYGGTFAYVTVGSEQSCDTSDSQVDGYSGGTYCKCKYGVAVGGASCSPTPQTCPSSAGQPIPSNGASYTWAGIAAGAAGCVNGCAVYSEGTNSPGGGGVPYTVGNFYSAGSTCGPGSGAAPATVKPPDAAACSGATACAGTVNGATVCVACGTPSTTSVTSSDTTTTNPDGTTTTTPGNTVVKSTVDNGDGTTTTTTTTTTSAGAVTTKTSVGPTPVSGSGSGASASGSGTGSGSGSGNCTGTNCGDGTDSFGGSCSASFTCDGDAIQCAIAQEQHQRDCSFYQPDSAGGVLQDEASRFTTAKSDGVAPSWSPAASGNVSNTTIDFASGLDQSKVWGASCPADQSFSFLGNTLVISFSSLCGSLQILGSFIVAVTALACAGIVFKQ